MVDLSIGSLVWARFVGDEENEPGLTFYYPALIKHILDNRSDKVKVTYLDEEFMKTVAIKKSHVLLLSEDRIRKSDIRFCRRQSDANMNLSSVDQWIPTKIINLWGRRKPDVDSKSTMCMATKWSGYECRDSIDDTVRLVRMTDCAILVDENIIKEYAIRMPDNPVTSYELNFNSLTPRARKTSAVDTLLDKFPFYRHVFHFTPSTLAENYRVQIEHVMGGEVCDKLEVNEHDFSKKLICIAEDKGRTLNRYGSSAAFCLAKPSKNMHVGHFQAPGMSFFADWKEKLDVLSSELKPIQARLMRSSHHGHEDVHNAIEKLVIQYPGTKLMQSDFHRYSPTQGVGCTNIQLTEALGSEYRLSLETLEDKKRSAFDSFQGSQNYFSGLFY